MLIDEVMWRWISYAGNHGVVVEFDIIAFGWIRPGSSRKFQIKAQILSTGEDEALQVATYKAISVS